MDTSGHDVPILASGFLEKLDYERFGVGSEVLYVGYPNGMKDAQNGLALMCNGSIASIPELNCDGKGLIAIDGTVLEGNSGGAGVRVLRRQISFAWSHAGDELGCR